MYDDAHKYVRAAQRGLSGEGGGVNFQLFPLLGPPCILTGPNWHMHNLAIGPTI